jgi:threonine synthase
MKQQRDHIGNTTLREIDGVYFKCEFENPTGSVKDRSIAYQIKKLKEAGFKEAVISSSGNAAISASYYCEKEGVELTVFVSTHVNEAKLKKLTSMNTKVIQSKKPVSESMMYAKEKNAFHLRQSLDPNAVIGYEQIGHELLEELPGIDAVFVPVSSGTMFAGIGRALKNVAMHAIQTSAVHPISEQYDNEFVPEEKSLADGIVAKVTAREKEIKEIIGSSKGSAWVVSNAEITEAFDYLKSKNLPSSYEGAAALAGYWKANKKGYIYKKPVCILSGTYYAN